MYLQNVVFEPSFFWYSGRHCKHKKTHTKKTRQVRVGRGSEKFKVMTDGPTDKADWRNDRLTCRVACTRLKNSETVFWVYRKLHRLHNAHNKGFHPYWKCITKEPRVIFNIKGSPHRVKCYVKLIQSFDWSKKGVDKLKVMLKDKFKGFILTLIETLWFLFLTLDLWA